MNIDKELHHKASGLKMTYKRIVSDCDIGPMIDARRAASQGVGP